MKSNWPRSALWAKRRNESNSMWLPAAGSLHTVVLFTPGKCAARWTCLIGLLIGGRSFSARSRDAKAVAVGRPGQAEQPAQGGWPAVALVAGAERAAPLQLGHERVSDLNQVMRQRGQLGRGAREDVRVACVRDAGPLVQALTAGTGGRGGVVEEHDDVAEQP